MNLAFFDGIPWDYDAATPYERPLGGSQSAFCYLSVALAARGHAVTTYTATTNPRVFQGVQCRSYRAVQANSLAGCDALIVLNGPAQKSVDLRPHVPARCRLILWTQHSFDQPAMRALEDPGVARAWDRIVCVSQWHAATMQRRFGLDPRRMAVMRNAISPAFANLFPNAAALAVAKSAAPVLAYTSTPFRGLNVLIAVFPELYRLEPRLRLKVYSSMKVYGQDESADPFAALYAQCRSTPGVEFVGSLPQPLLADALKSVMILAYPNTFAETSCIAVMEAMAAGLFVVTSDLGALPETTMGTGMLTPGPQNQDDLIRFARAYAEQFAQALGRIGRDPQSFWSARWDQVRAINAHCTWPVRAAEWEQLLQTL